MPRMQRPTAPRYRRRIFVLGMAAAAVLFCIGFPIYVNRIENDLERRVPEELAEQGIAGISASFSGQDGTLSCAEPLADPESVTAAAYDVWGVRKITLERACRVNTATAAAADGSADALAATADASGESSIEAEELATIADAVAGDADLSFLSVLLRQSGLDAQLADPDAEPVTLFAPTDDAFDALPADVGARLRTDPELLAQVLTRHVTSGAVRSSALATGPLTMLDGTVVAVVAGATITIDDATVTTPDIVTGNGVVHVIDRVLVPPELAAEATAVQPAEVAATLDAGAFTLTGVVASEVERAALVGAADGAIGEGNVVDQLTVDPDTGLAGQTANGLAALIGSMPADLVSGVSGFDGTSLYVRGVYVSEATRDAMQSVADAVGAGAELEPRPDASAADAAALETALNEFVAANPIRFEPTSAVLSADATGVLDELAAQALAFGGVTITIEGHTDSDGDANVNLALSQQRAEAVVAALVERGLDPASLTAEGFGDTQPVLVDGVEDKDASRRVEFRIGTAA